MPDTGSMNKIIIRFRKALFFLFSFQYKSVGFKSLIIRPLRIVGKKYISIGNKTLVKEYTWLLALKIDGFDPVLDIGQGSSIGEFNHITSVREVIIGKNVLTANRVYISDNVHGYEDIETPIMDQPVKFKNKVYIGDGSWLGENVCVIGASVGKNCVVGANSVVTKNIPAHALVYGNPARQQGWICKCGVTFGEDLVCKECNTEYHKTDNGLDENNEDTRG